MQQAQMTEQELRKELSHTSALIEQLREENSDLKIKLVEADAILSEERMLKESKYPNLNNIALVKLDKRMDTQKHDALAQCWDYRMSFEERVNLEREKNHQLSQEKLTLEEKIKRLQIQLSVALETKDHLEKENVNLNNQLGSETMKVFRLKAEGYQDPQQAEAGRLREIYDKVSARCRVLERKLADGDSKQEALLKMRYEEQVRILTADNERLLSQLKTHEKLYG